MNQDTFKIPGREIQCCGNCEYGSYDKMQGYVCVNGDRNDRSDPCTPELERKYGDSCRA